MPESVKYFYLPSEYDIVFKNFCNIQFFYFLSSSVVTLVKLTMIEWLVIL